MDQRQPLTRVQERILDVIRDSVRVRGYPPSVRELAEQTDLSSTASVCHQLQVLQARGYILRERGAPRALTIVDDPNPGPAAQDVLWFLKGTQHPRTTTSGADRYTCPGCQQPDLQLLGIPDVAYVFDLCTCRDQDHALTFDHLVEQLWHRDCLTRSGCADQG